MLKYICLFSFVFGSIFATFKIEQYIEQNTISENEMFLLGLLKDNLNNKVIYEGTPSFISGSFYLNKNNDLEISNIKTPICENLKLDGYNCNSGILITDLEIDPMFGALELISKATSKIAEAKTLSIKYSQ